jgi:hypothetical protein
MSVNEKKSDLGKFVLYAYSIRDIKTNAFGAPFFLPSHAAAMRAFSDLTRDPQSMISKHPEDFTLHAIGGFETEAGVLHGLPSPDYLATGVDFAQVA